MELDLSTEFGRRVERRLREERVIWLVTVGPNATPQPSPVWFLWDGETFLIYSRPERQKLRNIARSSRVALHLDSDGRGGDIVIITGEAETPNGFPPADQVAAYAEKYASGFQRIGMSPEEFSQTYSVAIRVRPLHLRGH